MEFTIGPLVARMINIYYEEIGDYDSLNDKILNLIFKNINLKEYNKILIKPNVLGPYPPDRCATTHPKFLEWIIKYLLNEGVDRNKIIVGDSSGYSTKKSFEVSKIEEVCRKYNINCKPFEKDEVVKVKVLDTEEIILPKTVLESDLLINLPKLKTHILMKYTGAIKNLYGCIPGGLKPKLHGQYPKEYNFAELLVELYNTIEKNREMITIMDSIYGMEGNGPSNGNSINSKIVIASKDALAVDIFASYYIKYNPMDIITNKILINNGNYKKRDIWQENYKIIKLEENINKEVNFKEIDRIKFKKPDTYYLTSIMPPSIVKLIFSVMVQKPQINRKKCKKCKVCQYICPVEAISIDNLKIDLKKCINCYCCHEMCEFGAIDLKRRFLI